MGKLSCACLNVQIHCKTEPVPVEPSSVGSYISSPCSLIYSSKYRSKYGIFQNFFTAIYGMLVDGYSTTLFWVVSCGLLVVFKCNMSCPSNLDL